MFTLTLFSGRMIDVPSMVISLEAFRPPLIHGSDVPLVGTTPGVRIASENGLRPFNGSSRIILLPITVDTLDEHNWLDDLNPDSKKVITAYLEPGLRNAQPEDRFQFERHGYFVTDRVDHRADKPVFNRVSSLRDNWGK